MLRINDARNFFRTATQQYDLIIYGVLDSHTALSHASNLRVDSYVYTREGITEAFKLLKPDGAVAQPLDLINEALGDQLAAGQLLIATAVRVLRRRPAVQRAQLPQCSVETVEVRVADDRVDPGRAEPGRSGDLS